MKLRITDLTKSFTLEDGNTIEALGPLNLEVSDGEFVCILGPSGCGKTTLLRIIGGLERPTSGTISLNSATIEGPNPSMAMIFQEYSLFPWRSVLDNVAFGLEVRGLPKEERHRIARKYIELVGLSGFEANKPYELSGGMRQRVAVARALAIEPKVLLMDEPFGAIDAQARNKMQRELLQIWEKTRKTVLFVTHSVDEAVYLADRIVILTRRPGRIKEIVPVPHHHPRERTEPSFVEIRRYVLRQITEESEIGTPH
ncbi:MAG: ABC transporter ATP-binding protein [Methanomicrobiales archaeon]|nr:ABC transporter ATP-binding protein [Methanomicrobiales archaeon]